MFFNPALTLKLLLCLSVMPECQEAMGKEFEALAANDTWSIVGLPSVNDKGELSLPLKKSKVVEQQKAMVVKVSEKKLGALRSTDKGEDCFMIYGALYCGKF
ncbi:hypothetical protein KY285_037680 [Solanum tuberosum]|nr:hypothetical protein KY285_037680 [Solanum tuberosum]